VDNYPRGVDNPRPSVDKGPEIGDFRRRVSVVPHARTSTLVLR
jgi:hypothetical protein